MRLNVTALRWILVLINASALGLVCWGAFALFIGERDELTMALPDASRFEVKERARGTTQSKDMAGAIRVIYKTKPKPVAPRTVDTTPKDLPPVAGGPLAAEWTVSSVYQTGDKVMASLKKKTVTTSKTASRRSRGRTTRPQRGRTPDPKKTPARRGPSTPSKYVVAGGEFRVGGKVYECTKIEFTDKKVYYKDGSRLYTLVPEEIESILSFEGGVIVMTGIPLDEDDAAAAAAAANDESLKGEIQYPGKADTKATANPNVRKSPVVPRTPPSRGARGRDKMTSDDVKKLNDSLKDASKADREALRKAMQELKNK